MDGPIFLTGGTGFLGGHLRRRLTVEAVETTLLARPGTDVQPHSNETVVRGDVTESVACPGARSVIHLAGQTSVERAVEAPEKTWAVNATGTLHVLEAAREADVDRFLYASTASVYGPPEYLPIDESHPLNAVEPYGASKVAADRLVHAYDRTYDLNTVTARLFNTYGPGQGTHNVVATIVEQALAGGPVELGNLHPSRDFLYVTDVIDAFETLLERGDHGEVYNVGSGRGVTVRKLARTVIDLVDPEIELVSTANRERDDDIEIERHVADPSELSALGWKPEYDLKEGIRATVER